jgi:hypothetical protein
MNILYIYASVRFHEAETDEKKVKLSDLGGL